MRKHFFGIIIICLTALLIISGVSFIKEKDYAAKASAVIESKEPWILAFSHFVNNNGIFLIVDDTGPKAVTEDQAYMNESMMLMFGQDTVVDSFDCAAGFYGGQTLKIEKGNKVILVDINRNEMSVNGETVSLDSQLEIRDNGLFVPGEILVKGLDYNFSWDKAGRVAEFTATGEDISSIPYYYNYVDEGRITSARDQGDNNTCWAFAATAALESSMLPERNNDFSEDHMIYHNGLGLSAEDGGDYILATAYLTSWTGPVMEADDPYGDGESPDDLEAAYHVQEIQMIEKKDYDTIKQMVFKYGAVESSIYFSAIDGRYIDEKYYNNNYSSYCYPEEMTPNHEIIIIGWDDGYPASNFNQGAVSDGAFICQNSWGNIFGDNGIFYVSYCDGTIGIRNEVYTKIEEKDNYGKIYQHDRCGWIGTIGFNRNKAYFANVYTAENNETLKAVSFYATGKDTGYRVFAVPEYNKREDLEIDGKECLAEGMFKNAGYYTVDLNQFVSLKKGEQFAVIVEINTPGSSHPIAMEMNANDIRTGTVTLEGKESYISNYGSSWQNCQKEHSCNVCLKAFTDITDSEKDSAEGTEQ